MHTRSLSRFRQILQQSFYTFGIHCATHRIRVLLISCIVITSLFYPALALYSSSQPQFLARFSSTLGSLAGRGPQHDLHEVWTDHEALRAQDSVTSLRCGTADFTLRSERVLARTDSMSSHGALNRGLLTAVHQLQHRIKTQLAISPIQCLRRSNGECFTISPTSFWHDDPQTLGTVTDAEVMNVLAYGHNTSVSGVPVTPCMVLAERETLDDDKTLDWANYMSLTYFFPENDCTGNAGHGAWLEVLRQATGPRMRLDTPRSSPKLLAYQYDPHSANQSDTSVLTWFIYLAYVAFFFWFSGSMRQLHTVHSRIGLALTGLVEIIVSTITSLSVCALAGFKITLVPWQLFPVIIVFVGAENMFALVNAVVNTSIALPVKTRIAEGMSRAGASNTLKVVSYNVILGVIAVFSEGAIRQFCALALVVLVAHWFLVHTFFIAVLSIDIQRLELNELLRQNLSLMSSPKSEKSLKSLTHKTTWSKVRLGAQKIWTGRASRNLSLLMLLAITGTLHYATSPSKSAVEQDVRALTREQMRAAARNNSTFVDLTTPALQVWRTLNPSQDAILHIRQEAPIIVTFQASASGGRPDLQSESQSHGNANSPSGASHYSRITARTVRQASRLVRLVIFPIALTTTLLYGILLYLLKDQEIYDAQRHRLEAEPATPSTTSTLSDHVAIALVPLERRFPSDVELLASSSDGTIVAALGLHNELVIWRRNTGVWFAVDHCASVGMQQGPPPPSSSSSSSSSVTLTALALDPEGKYIAVGTSTGVVITWSIGDRQAFPLSVLPYPESQLSAPAASAVLALEFIKKSASTPMPLPRSSDPKLDCTLAQSMSSIATSYNDGRIFRWTIAPKPIPVAVLPKALGVVEKCMLVRASSGSALAGDEVVLAGFVLDDGSLHVKDLALDIPIADNTLPAGSPSDPVAVFHAATTRIGATTRLVIAAITSSGSLTVWDGATGECVAALQEDLGVGVSQLLITSVPKLPCTQCEEPVADLLSISLVVRSTVVFFRLTQSSAPAKCRCARSRVMEDATWRTLIRPRRSSGGSGRNTPRTRSRANSFNSEIPISGHGIHSRRASDKEAREARETGRRTASEVLGLTGLGMADGSPGGQGNVGTVEPIPTALETLGLLPRSSGSFSSSSSPWREVLLEPTAHCVMERGTCAIVGHRIVGLRRRPRTLAEGNSKSAWASTSSGKGMATTGVDATSTSLSALSSSAMERWELWAYDPLVGYVQASPLLELSSANPDPPARKNSLTSLSSLISPSKPGPSRAQVAKAMTRRSSVPRLPFTRVSAIAGGSTICLAGLGNTVVTFGFES